MDLNYYVDIFITITIVIFFIWVFMLVCVGIYSGCNIMGLIETAKNSKLNPDESVIAGIISIFSFLLYPILLYLTNVTVVLSYIFWLWLLIVLFVPHLVFVGFIPIPLKIPILLFVPPFKTLTDRGIIPLILRIATRLFKFLVTQDQEYLYKKNVDDIYNFVYNEIKTIFTKLFKILKIDTEYFIQQPNVIDDIDTSLEQEEDPNEEEAKKILNSFEEDDDKIKIKKLINEEIAICIANKSKELSSDLSSSELFMVPQINRSNYAECYAKSLNLYINNQI
jgi:hypothetical protein